MSSEKFRLTNLSIEGFRGINKTLNLDISGLPTVICGPNGVGKTSILQAIEWGICGRIPNTSGTEFDMEDAIVNQFCPNETAKVELKLESQKKKMKIVRTREKARWSRKKSNVSLDVNGRALNGKDAEAKIQELLDITEDEFYAGKYLHQKSLRDFIIGYLKTRSAMMDELLGTHSLREITDALPITRAKRITQEIQQQIETLKSTELRKLPRARAKLEDTKKSLLKKGIAEDDLDIRFLPSLFNELQKKIENIAEKIDIHVSHLEMPPENLTALQKAISRLGENINLLEKSRFKKYRELSDKRMKLTSMRDKYKNMLETLQGIEDTDRETIQQKILEVEEQLDEKKTKLKKFRGIRDFLQREKIALEELQQNLENHKKTGDRLVSEHGDVRSVKEQITNLEQEKNKFRGKIESLETYSQMITSALEFLKDQKPDICPVCKSLITPLEIAEHLEKELSQAEGGSLILEQKQRLKKIQSKLHDLHENLDKMNNVNDRLKKASETLDKQRKKIKRKAEMTEISPNSVKERLNKTGSELEKLESSVDQLKSKKGRLEDNLAHLSKTKESLSDLTREIRTEIGTEEMNFDLLTTLSKKLEKTEKKIASFEKITPVLERSNDKFMKLQDIHNYLTRESEVLQLEQEFPELEALKRELTDKHKRLQRLVKGLEDIKHAASAEQKSIVSDMLGDIESEINQYYSKLIGHTYYDNLKLSLKARRNKNIYWIKASGPDYETHVKTRFSNAQLNSVAIAIFLSMSKRISRNLNLAILDDPTQSMDQIHKKALTKMLASESTEKQLIIATQNQKVQEELAKLITPNKQLKVKSWNTEGPVFR